VVEAVGDGIDSARVGQRVWVYGAQSYRPFGTAAEFTVVPAGQAVPLPDEVGDATGACLGIPGITAHRAVFGDGPVAGRTVLVHGVLGAVGLMAAQLARRGGATIIGTVRRRADLEAVDAAAMHAVALDAEAAKRSGRTRPTARTASSTSPSRTTRTSTPPSPHPTASSLPTPRATTGRPFRSGRCCSRT
jgi:NADPH2:quinone reductase